MGLFVARGVVQGKAGRETDNSVVVCKVYLVRVFVGGGKDVCSVRILAPAARSIRSFFLSASPPAYQSPLSFTQHTWRRNCRGNRHYRALPAR